MFNKKRVCYIYGIKLWIKRLLSEVIFIFFGVNIDESVIFLIVNLIKFFLGFFFLKCCIFKLKLVLFLNFDVFFFIVFSINWFLKRVFIMKGFN